MSEKTKISWTDSTCNWWTGCTKVSAGCLHCFAEALSKRYGWGEWGDCKPRHKFTGAAKNLTAMNCKPWVCDKCGEAQKQGPTGSPLQPADAPVTRCVHCGVLHDQWHRRRVFHNDLSDWPDPQIPIAWLSEMLDGIRLAPDVTHILCTKRLELWRERMSAALDWAKEAGNEPLAQWLRVWDYGKPEDGLSIPSNIIVLASVENQQTADGRIPHLLRIPAACRGLSMEPLLGPVDLGIKGPKHLVPKLGWVIVGGESGPDARPCNVEWIRSIVQQCQSAGVPVHVKQIGSNSYVPAPYGPITHPKGGDMAEWSQDLRVREWPCGL